MSIDLTIRFYEVDLNNVEHHICSIGATSFDYFLDVKNLLAGKKITNGCLNKTTEKYFNGMDCLAAWLIGKLKGDQIGKIYIVPENLVEAADFKIWAQRAKGSSIDQVQDIFIDITYCGKDYYSGIIGNMPDKEPTEDIYENL